MSFSPVTSDDEYDTYSESDESESGSNNLEYAELDLESLELELSTDGTALNLPSHLPSSEPLASSTESDGHCERYFGCCYATKYT